MDEVVEHLQTPAAVAAPCCGVRIMARTEALILAANQRRVLGPQARVQVL